MSANQNQYIVIHLLSFVCEGGVLMAAGSLFRSDPLFLLARNPELDDHACQHLLDANGFGGL